MSRPGVLRMGVVVGLALGLTMSLAAAMHAADSAPGAKEAPPKTVKFWGVVVDRDGRGAAGAKVTVEATPADLTTTTDAEGKFSLEAPTSGVRGGTVVAAGDNGDLGMAAPTGQMTSDGVLGDLRIELKPARKFEVHVVDAENRPAAGAEVVASANFRIVARTATDEHGLAAMAIPQDAKLQFLLATKDGVGVDYASFRDPRSPASDPYQRAPDFSGRLKLELAPALAVTVRVVDAEGQGVAGAEVHPWYIKLPKHGSDANLGLLWSQTTNEQGEATFRSIPATNEGLITFWVQKKGFVAQERANFDPKSASGEVVSTLLPLVAVSGRVVDADGTPAGGIPVAAAGANQGMDNYHDATTTDAEGKFTFQAHPDMYCLFAAGNDEVASPVAARVVRAGKPVDGIELKLGPATRVFGQVTLGQGGKGAAGEYVQLYQKDVPDYYDLPEEERLPAAPGNNIAVSPRLVKSTPTDEEGRFEFRVGPGEFYLIGQQTESLPPFTIDGEKEREFTLVSRKALTEGNIKGRVVLASAPEQGVERAAVFSYPEDFGGRHIRATTDDEGRFEDRRPGVASLIGAFSEDRSLGGIMRLDAEQTEFTLELAPTASVGGTIFDEETGGPGANRSVTASIRVGPKDGPFMMAFQKDATTDADGRFEIAGLVPGQEYEVAVVSDKDDQGHARGWRNVGKAKPETAEKIALGELRLPAPYREPTLEERVATAFFGKGSAAKRLKRALDDAKLNYLQVLVVAADPESEAAREFIRLRYDFDGSQREFRNAVAEYMIVAVDAEKAAKAMERIKVDSPAAGGAVFAILNVDGEVAARATAEELSEDGKLSAARVTEFLVKRRVPLPNAREELDAALARARSEDKRVLVQVGGPGCGWCVVLARYLDRQKELVDKDYVYLKLDSRMPEAGEVIGELREKKEGGVPWMTILDAEGKTLVTSDAEETGNIGYPGEPEGRAHFEKMLRETRQRLTDDELSAMLKPLEEKP